MQVPRRDGSDCRFALTVAARRETMLTCTPQQTQSMLLANLDQHGPGHRISNCLMPCNMPEHLGGRSAASDCPAILWRQSNVSDAAFSATYLTKWLLNTRLAEGVYNQPMARLRGTLRTLCTLVTPTRIRSNMCGCIGWSQRQPQSLT